MFKVNFMANQSVTDEDINAIGYNLSNTVYTTFENGVTYGIDALNEITARIMTKGVKKGYGRECAVTLVGGNVFIDSGLAFFSNGAAIIIDEDGISLPVVDSTEKQYIYLFFNVEKNVAGARCTVEFPSEDFVMLGSIIDGTLTLNRTYAFLNSDVYETNEGITLTLEPSDAVRYDYVDSAGYGHSSYYVEYSSEVNVSNYKRAIFYTPLGIGDYMHGIIDIQKNEIMYFTAVNNSYEVIGKGNSFLAEDTTPIQDGRIKLQFSREGLGVYVWGGPEECPITIELYGGVSE